MFSEVRKNKIILKIKFFIVIFFQDKFKIDHSPGTTGTTGTTGGVWSKAIKSSRCSLVIKLDAKSARINSIPKRLIVRLAVSPATVPAARVAFSINSAINNAAEGVVFTEKSISNKAGDIVDNIKKKFSTQTVWAVV